MTLSVFDALLLITIDCDGITTSSDRVLGKSSTDTYVEASMVELLTSDGLWNGLEISDSSIGVAVDPEDDTLGSSEAVVAIVGVLIVAADDVTDPPSEWRDMVANARSPM